MEVGGTGVVEGRGVWVGGRVEVMMTSGVVAGVSGAATSALQAVLKKTKTVSVVDIRVCCKRLCGTILLYPILRCKCWKNYRVFRNSRSGSPNLGVGACIHTPPPPNSAPFHGNF